mgnify:CR=1 FL=1
MRRALVLVLAVGCSSLDVGCTYLTNFARPIVEPPPDAGPEDAGLDALAADGDVVDAADDAMEVDGAAADGA